MTSASGLALPAWRGLLESRWQRRLAAVIRLSAAYHDASDQPAEAARLRRLMRQAVAARRALSDTEEALARLSAGSYGRCEQCGAAIPVAELTAEPEARYCGRCTQTSRGQATRKQTGRKPTGRAQTGRARNGTRTELYGEVRTWRG